MVIPTVQFGNIQPEIIVKANSVDEAHDFIVPHMNKLWKEYYLVDGKRPKAQAPTAPVKTTVTPVTTTYIPLQGATGDLIPPKNTPSVPNPSLITSDQIDNPVTSPVSSVALVKATQAIESCMSLDALKLIINQVKISVKLTEDDKKSLEPLLAEKEIELNGKK